MKKYQSRLLRHEEARTTRNIFFYFFLILVLIGGIFFGGVPVLVKIASFFSDINTSSTPSGELDTTPPVTPRFNLPADAVNTNPISISGFTEGGAKIIIYLNDFEYKQVVAGEDGSFTAGEIHLNEGTNHLYVIAVDSSGNMSAPSAKIQITFDKTPPPLEISEPPNNSTFSGSSKKKLVIKGLTDPLAQFRVNGNLEFLTPEGNFTTTYNLNEGENIIKFEAIDPAGNKTEKELKITFVP